VRSSWRRLACRGGATVSAPRGWSGMRIDPDLRRVAWQPSYGRLDALTALSFAVLSVAVIALVAAAG